MNRSSPAFRIAGFIPAYNAAATVGATVRSLLDQSIPLSEVLVIDDASTDDTALIAARAGARVVRMATNSGRGAVRARGVELLDADFIVSVDAGNTVRPDFAARAMPGFDDPTVGAVVGHWWEPAERNMAQRWRARHLFKVSRQPRIGESRYLATHGCILRRSAVLDAGNFKPSLRHTEDAVLGWLMQQKGWKILPCPEARVIPQTIDPLPVLAKRYWRWHTGSRERWSFSRYFQSIKNACFVMAPLDWRAHDIPSLFFTLLLPHWIALYTIWRRLSDNVQK